jgi:hypothetical protein
VFSTAFNTNANAGGIYTAGGVFTVSSRLDSTVDAIAFAGGAGFVGLGAAVSVLSDSSYVQSALADSARVKAAASVDVTAVSNRAIHLNTDQGAVGAVALGASFTRLTSSGQVSADVGAGARIGQDTGLNVGALHVSATADFDTYAHTLAFSVGAVAISANFAIVDVKPLVRASVGDASLIKTTGEATVDAVTTGKADAKVLTVTAGAGATGVSLSSATFSPVVQALFGATSVLNAGGLIRVQARNNHNGTSALANKGAWAKSTAPGFGGFSGNGAVPTAEANGSVKRGRQGRRAGLQQQRGAGRSPGVVRRRRDRRRQRGQCARQRRHGGRAARRRGCVHRPDRACPGAQPGELRLRRLQRRHRRHQRCQQHRARQRRRAHHHRRRGAGRHHQRQRRHRHRVARQQ